MNKFLTLHDLVEAFVELHYKDKLVAVLYLEGIMEEDYEPDNPIKSEVLEFFGVDETNYFLQDIIIKEITEAEEHKVIFDFENCGYIGVYKNGRYEGENT